MEKKEALKRIEDISRIAERVTLYTMLPGWPSVIGGILALGGCAASWGLLKSLDFQALNDATAGSRAAVYLIWTFIGVAGIIVDVTLSARQAKRAGYIPAASPARFAAFSLGPYIAVAIALSARILLDGQYQYLAPIWMMCYGTGVYAAGLFSIRLPRLLGIVFLATGIAALFEQTYPYSIPLTALSFGGYHMAFGAVVLARARRDKTD